jgi:predicted site-specific integrase-resolvase
MVAHQTKLTISQLSRELQVSPITIRKAIDQGRISVEINPLTGRKRIDRSEIDRLVREATA